jgi:hypothetical protein
MGDSPRSLTLAAHSGDDGAMRWLRANSSLLLITATVATFMAALTLQAGPVHLVASLLVAVTVVVLTRFALTAIRAWGARPAAIVAVLALAGLALAMQVVPLVVEMGWIRVLLIVLAWGGLLLASVEPRMFVRATGGPQAAWSLLRERAALWNDIRDLTDEQLAAEPNLIPGRVSAFDRYRTPGTAAYIDIFQRLTFGDDPPEVKEQLAGRLSQLEGDLVRSLGVPPAWEVEFGRYAPAPAADA